MHMVSGDLDTHIGNVDELKVKQVCANCIGEVLSRNLAETECFEGLLWKIQIQSLSSKQTRIAGFL